MSCPDTVTLAFVNALLCIALYFYITWGIDVISLPVYPTQTVYQRFTVFIRQAVLALVLFASAPYFMNITMRVVYKGLEALCNQ